MTQLPPDPDEAPPLPPASPDVRLLPAALATWAAAWWATTRSAGLVLTAAAVAAIVACLALALRHATAAPNTGEWARPPAVPSDTTRRHKRAEPVRATPAVRRLGAADDAEPWAEAGVRSAAEPARRRSVTSVAPVLALALAAAAVVLAASAFRLEGRAAGSLPEWAQDRAVATVAGRISGDPHPVETRMRRGRRWAVRVLPDTVSARGRIQHDVHGPLLVLGDARWSSVAAGSHVRLTGRLLPPRPGDPTIAAIAAQTAPATIDHGAWPWRAAERLRTGLRAACTGLPKDAAVLLPALVVGDTSALPDHLRADLRAAGLTHLTAVSGANCAIVAATVSGSLALAGAGRRGRVAGTLLAIAAFVVLARPEPSVLRAAVMGGVALVGILLARREIALAALCTATIALLTVDPWLSRSFGFVLSVLATGALVLLVPVWVDTWPLPRLVATALAVPLAAQAATAPVVVLLQSSVSLVGIPANVLAAPAVAPATVGGVLAAALSPLWPAAAHLVAVLAGLPTAWIAIVAHAGAGMPGGSLPWLPGRLGALLLALMAAGAVLLSLRPGRAAADSGDPPADSPETDGDHGLASDADGGHAHTAAIPHALGAPGVADGVSGASDTGARPVGTPVPDSRRITHIGRVTTPGGLGVLSSVSLPARLRLAVGSHGPPRIPRPPRIGGADALRPTRPPSSPHRATGPTARRREHLRSPLPWAVGLLVIAVLLGWVLGPRLFGGNRRAAAAWSVVQCEVGQGDAMLLRSGDHHAMLVDAGPDPEIADRCLHHWGVDALDLVVVTHFHADHVGGLTGALRGRGSPPVLVTPCRRPDDGYRAMTDAARAAGSAVTVGRAGASGRLGDPRWPISWRVLWPPADTAACVATPTGDEDDAANDSSVVLSVDVQGIRVLALGDLQTEPQRSLAAAIGAAEPVDVVKVAHHGSAKQDPALYAAVRPRVALIGVGRGNDYGQPESATLAMLDESGAHVLRTDEQGDLAVIGPATRLTAITVRRRRPAPRVRGTQRAPPRGGDGWCRRLVGGCLRGSVRRLARRA